jgi:hypothetical protein
VVPAVVLKPVAVAVIPVVAAGVTRREEETEVMY